MKLKDLKQGMVGELRNKRSIVVVTSRNYFTDGFSMFHLLEEKYNDDLTHKEHKHLDIMEVSFGNGVIFKRNENRWFVPEVGKKYYFTTYYGEITSFTNTEARVDNEIFNSQRVFKTEEEAEKRLRQQQATLSVERWIAENDVGVDVCDTDITKYYIVYDIGRKELRIDYYNHYITAPKQFTLSNGKKAEELIKEREKELKIMLGVEE